MVEVCDDCRGPEGKHEIASAPRLRGLAFGGGDLSCELRVRRTGIGGDRNIWDYPFEHLYAKERLVVAARAAGIEKAIDTGWAHVRRGRHPTLCHGLCPDLGFDGFLGPISPRQIPHVHAEFTPSERDVESAMKIVAAAEEAEAVGRRYESVEGQMTDGPFVRSAYQILQRSKEAASGPRPWPKRRRRVGSRCHEFPAGTSSQDAGRRSASAIRT